MLPNFSYSLASLVPVRSSDSCAMHRREIVEEGKYDSSSFVGAAAIIITASLRGSALRLLPQSGRNKCYRD